jgi:uncharacterized protein
MTEPISYYPGDILRETLREIYETLGKGIENLSVERVVEGFSLIGVKLSNGAGGLCDIRHGGPEDPYGPAVSLTLLPPPGRHKERRLVECVNEAFGFNPKKKALAIAVMNALSATCRRDAPPDGYEVKTGLNALDEAAFPDAGYTVVTGVPDRVVTALKKRRMPFGILEADRAAWETDKIESYIQPEMVTKKLRLADFLILAGTTLVDDSLEYLLGLKRPGASVLIAGCAASMLPGAFFRRGVTALGGIKVIDADRALDAITEAGSGCTLFDRGAERIVVQPAAGRARSMARYG